MRSLEEIMELPISELTKEELRAALDEIAGPSSHIGVAEALQIARAEEEKPEPELRVIRSAGEFIEEFADAALDLRSKSFRDLGEAFAWLEEETEKVRESRGGELWSGELGEVKLAACGEDDGAGEWFIAGVPLREALERMSEREVAEVLSSKWYAAVAEDPRTGELWAIEASID